jgi:hypothetical protein
MRARTTAALVAISAASALLGSSLAGGQTPEGDPPAPEVGTTVVAKVTTLAGTRLFVERKDHEIQRLAVGGEVRLGDIVAVGPGTTATMALTVPDALAEDDVLLSLYKQLGQEVPKASNVAEYIGILTGYARDHPALRVTRTGTVIEARVG